MKSAMKGMFFGWTALGVLMLCLFSGAGRSMAQEVKPKPKPGSPDTGVEAGKGKYKGMIFEVTPKKGKGTVTLAGSVHMLRSSDHPLPASYEKAFEAAETVVFEIPPSDMAKPKNLAVIQQAAVFTDGTTLKDHLSKEVYDRLRKVAQEIGAVVVPQMRPWFAAQMIGVQLFLQQGFEPQFGIDMHYESRAAKAGKNIEGLETVEFQLGLFANLPDDEQAALVVNALDDLDESEEFIAELMESWKSGEAKRLGKAMNDAMLENKDLGKALLYDRNKNWIDPIEGYLAGDKNVMIVVGAGHLVGKGSVVDLLKKKGYEIQQK